MVDIKRGEFHLAFAMYLIFLCKLISIKNRKKFCIYAGFVDFCPIIPYSSILRTIPVAFIYKSISLLYKFVLLVSVNTRDLYW